MELKLYYYFSYWAFIWFILFKLNHIQYSPYLIYLFIVILITLKLINELYHYIYINKEKINNKLPILLWLLLILIIDIIPFLFLQKKLDNASIYFTLLLLGIYSVFMTLNDKNIFTLYGNITYKKINKLNLSL